MRFFSNIRFLRKFNGHSRQQSILNFTILLCKILLNSNKNESHQQYIDAYHILRLIWMFLVTSLLNITQPLLLLYLFLIEESPLDFFQPVQNSFPLLVIIQRLLRTRIKQLMTQSRITTFKIATILTLLALSFACDDGMYASSNGQCVQCDISCNTCRSSDGCSTCYDQMYLLARGNTIVCQICYNVNKGCDVCLTGAKCQSCSAGFFMQQDSTCAPCSSLTPNCLLCFDGNATRCISCEQSYQLVNGVCVGNGSSTNISASAGLTSSGSQGNTQSQSQGIVQQSQANGNQQSQGSTQQSFTSLSTQTSNGGCDPSQISINGVCYPTIPFCQTYSQTDGTCAICVSIFVLSNGYCLPSTLISGSTSSPQQTQTSGTSQSGSSSSSATAYSSSSPTDTIYSPCSSHQYYSNGICVDVGVECTQFDQITGACYACASGFQVYNGLCVQTQSNSIQSSSSGSTMPPHCQLANPIDTTKCLSCVSGYTIVDEFPGVCYQIN